MRRPSKPQLSMLTVGVAAIAVTLALAGLGVFARTELWSVDARFAARGDHALAAPITLVAIDNATFAPRPGRPTLPRWQDWSRSYHAKVIDRLRRAGAKVIAYDVEFSEASDDPEADFALFEAARRARPTVFSTTQGRDGGSPIFGGPANQNEIGMLPGRTNLINDKDSAIRRLELSRGGIPSFAVQTAQVFLGPDHPPASPPSSTPWIDYAGPPGTVPRLSFSHVWTGDFDPSAVRGRIVVIGATAESLQDIHETSVSGEDRMPGAEIQANAIATALAGYPLREVPGGIELLLVAVLGMVAPITALRYSAARVVVGCLLLMVVFIAAVQVAFTNGWIVPAIAPIVALALSAGGALAVGFSIESRARRRTRDLFARFVPEAVVDDVIARAGGLRLGGVRVVSTVMFTDLRGFTTFSETRPPDEVLDILNRYLTTMSDAILDNGGTLVSYLGDGIMALFGAPLEQIDHADRAIDASVEMLRDRMPEFNAWLVEQGVPPFRMGIGLNTGPIMAGNVGSLRRMDYTAIGDTTNTASRLEGLTKGNPSQLYLSDTTRRSMTRPGPPLEQVGDMEIRGRADKLLVWGLPDSALGVEVPPVKPK